MSWNVTTFPVEKRVKSEKDGIWWVIYYRVEWMARMIHFLLGVLARQDPNNTERSQWYKYVRKRTIKRCILALSRKWEGLEKNIQDLKTNNIAFDTAISIFLALLRIKQKHNNRNIESFKEELDGIDPSVTDIELIILLLSQFHLASSEIIQALNGHTAYQIHWYEDDVYSFLRRLQRMENQ